MQAAQRLAQHVLPARLASAMGIGNAAFADDLTRTLRRALAKRGTSHDAPLTLGSFYFASEHDLPPLLAPVPSLCRLMALLVVLPFLVVCMVDFAGYAIFRTLGFQRRRVRVKARNGKLGRSEASAKREADRARAQLAAGNTSPSLLIRAPVLQPGSYDADTLLRHRARSISGESTEAEEEWERTGGSFARVSHVRAAQQAAAAAGNSTLSRGNDAPSSYADAAATDVNIPTESTAERNRPQRTATSNSTMTMTPPESPRQAFLNAGDVGVDGALGYFDTDAEDSGAETPASGTDSPEETRKRRPQFNTGSRRGLKGSSFSFTPVMPGGTATGRSTSAYFGDTQGGGAFSSTNTSGANSPVNGLGIGSSSSSTSS